MGHLVETKQHPQWNSVEEYIDYLKMQSPNKDLKRDLIDPDIECVCCTQQAPAEAAAMIKVEDHTPTSIDLDGQKGKQVWICADCYHFGVRPKYVKFNSVNWNQEGRKIKKRAEKRQGHPW